MTKIADNTFAAACYDNNSIEEIRAALAHPKADATDCEEWGITPTEWREQLQQALEAKLADAE